MVILHALTKSSWESNKNNDFYGDESLKKCGFIHCSDLDTYHLVAPNFKDDPSEMVLLLIDTEKVSAKIVWEDLGNYGTKYPHIYGLLNKDAILAVLPHLWNDRREWVMNDELKAYLSK